MTGEAARVNEELRAFSPGGLADRLPLALFRSSVAGKILWANQAMADLFGHADVDALLAVNALDLFAEPAERDRLLEELAAGEVLRGRPVRLRSADGSPLHGRLTISPLVDGDGRVEFLEAAIEMDGDGSVSASPSGPARVAPDAFEATGLAMMLFDADLWLLGANPPLASLLGGSVEELEARHLAEVVPDLAADGADVRLARLRDGELLSFTIHCRLRTRDGGELPARVTVSPYRGAPGRPLAFLGQVTDGAGSSSASAEGSAGAMSMAFDTSPVGMGVVDAGLSRVRINSAFRRVLGIAADDVDTFDAADLMHPDDFGSAAERAGELASGSLESYTTERRLRHRDGHMVSVALAVTALRSPTGEFKGLFSQVIDMTAQQRVEKALRDSEARFRTAYDSAPVGMVLLSPDLEVRSVNAAMCRMLRCTAEEILTVPVPALMGADAARAGLRHMERLLAGDPVPPFELEIQRRDGTVIWTLNTASAIRDAAGTITGLISQTVDVTDQHLAQQARAVSEAENRALLESIPDLMFRLDAYGVIQAYRAGQALGPALPPEVFLGKSIEEIYPHKAEPMMLAIEAVLASGRPESVEYELDIDGEPRVFEARVSKMSDDEVLSLIRDITDRKRVEEQLQALVHSKDEFVAAVSHELRTPLTTVVGLASELQDRAEQFTPAERAEFVRLIADQSREMADLVEDLLAAAQADVGLLSVEPMFVDVRREIGEVVAALAHRKVTVHPGPDVVALADPFRVRQVVRNLVTNAIRYGGDAIEIGIEAADDVAVVRVCDNGAGIPEQEWELIFDPYYRAHHRAGQPASLGLGLSIGRMLAWLMNGELTYAYEDGWSIFELSLPIPRQRGA